MGMSLSRTEWTAEMLSTLPDDGQRYEIIDGELFVTPMPALVHQRAAVELSDVVRPYAKALKLDFFSSPIDITFSDRRVLQPDLSVLPRTRDGKLAKEFTDVGVLLLAVEVLSPSSLRTDRREKRWVYQQERVEEYWIVDTEARMFERWTPTATEPQVLRQSLSWQPLVAHEPLIVDLVQYFRDVLDE